jgi:hypothetical protein
VPPYSRPRDGRDPIGTAIPRTPGTTTVATTVVVPAGFYYPLFGSYGVGLYGNSFWNRSGFYDPWYGSYPSYGGWEPIAPPVIEEGSLRLKIRPKDAEVYVDGNYVGIVDDFDGHFQRLPLTSGPHRLEVRAAGYEPLLLDVQISPRHTTVYEGSLQRVP